MNFISSVLKFPASQLGKKPNKTSFIRFFEYVLPWFLSVTWGGVGDWKWTPTEQSPNLPQLSVRMHLDNRYIDEIIYLCVLLFHLTLSSLRTWALSDLSLYLQHWTLRPAHGAQYLFIYKYSPDEGDKERRKKRKKREDEVCNLWAERGGRKTSPYVSSTKFWHVQGNKRNWIG